MLDPALFCFITKAAYNVIIRQMCMNQFVKAPQVT